MGKVQQHAGGSLTRADKAMLVPENIRQGVIIFEGTSHEIIGSLVPMPEQASITELGAALPVSSRVESSYTYNTPGNFLVGPTAAVDVTNYANANFQVSTQFAVTSGMQYTITAEIVQNGAVVSSVSSDKSQITNVTTNIAVDLTAITGYASFRISVAYSNRDPSNSKKYFYAYIDDIIVGT